MNLRLAALAALGATTLALAVVIARRPPVPQGFSVRPVLDRAVEAKEAVNHAGLAVIRLSDDEETQMGALFTHQDPQLQRRDTPENRYVQSVMDRVQRRGGVRRTGLTYTAQVIEHPSINAFALPGGWVYITSGMMAFLENEAELAAVLGHELAHVDLGHCGARIVAEVRLRRAGVPLMEGLAALGFRALALGYQDDQEHEADRWGMQVAARAGYAPTAARHLFERLSQLTHQPSATPRRIPQEATYTLQDAMADLFASHPTPSARIQSLRRAEQECGLPQPGVAYEVGATSPAFLGRNRHMPPGPSLQP